MFAQEPQWLIENAIISTKTRLKPFFNRISSFFKIHNIVLISAFHGTQGDSLDKIFLKERINY